MKKLFLFLSLSFQLTSWSFAVSNDRPKDALVGEGVEIPVNVFPSAGGVIDSVGTFHDRGFVMTVVAGEPVSGTMTSESYQLEMGYGIMEFYSDRIPVHQLELTVNGGSPVTNSRDIELLGIKFSDDLSGLESAYVKELVGKLEKQLDVKTENVLKWRLGAPLENIPDGDVYFEFTFADRAGNKTDVPVNAKIRLDRVAPSDGEVEIANGQLYTSTTVVSIRLRSNDNLSDTPTGVQYVRLSNSPNGLGKVFPFVEPQMSIQWDLVDATEGEKTVYAQFRDSAGNWSVNVVTDTINYGLFSPGGTLTFKDDGIDVIKVTTGTFESHTVNVPLLLGWNLSAKGTLKRIEITGGPTASTIRVEDDMVPPISPSYAIAVATAPDGPYKVNAQFFDAFEGGNGSSIATATIKLNRDPPSDPEVVTTVSSSTVQFTILSSSSHVRDLLYYTIVPSPELMALGASSATIQLAYSSQTITFVDYDLVPNTQYGYTIRAFDRFSGSPGFSTAPITYAEDPIKTKTPTGVEISVVRVEWGTGRNPIGTEYQVECAKDENFTDVITHSTWSFRNPIDIEGLTVASTYYFRVKARNSNVPPDVNVTWAYLGAGYTKSFVQPEAPTSLEAIAVASTSVTWRWIRNPSTEEGFALINDGIAIATITLTNAATTYEYTETGLTPNTLVSRYVQAFNHFRNALTFSPTSPTKPVRTRPAAPQLVSLDVQGSEISVSWKPNGNPDGTEYQIAIARTPGCDASEESSEWIKGLTFDFPGLRPQTTYYVHAKSRALPDPSNHIFESECVEFGSAVTKTFDHANEVELLGQVPHWNVVVPANALDEDFGIAILDKQDKFSTTTPDVISRATQKSMRETQGYRFPLPGALVEIKLYDINGETLQKRLKKSGEIQHEYEHLLFGASAAATSNADSGVISSAPDLSQPGESKQILVKTLRLYVLDPKTESWFRLPSNDLDQFIGQVNGGVSATAGVFAVMGSPSLEVDQAIAFPVPWRPNGPNAGSGPGQTGTEAGGITFANLPQEGSIKILDLQGSLVKEIQLSGNTTESWQDVRNAHGDKVVSGTYYWIVKAGDQTKTGKLVIIR